MTKPEQLTVGGLLALIAGLGVALVIQIQRINKYTNYRQNTVAIPTPTNGVNLGVTSNGNLVYVTSNGNTHTFAALEDANSFTNTQTIAAQKGLSWSTSTAGAEFTIGQSFVDFWDAPTIRCEVLGFGYNTVPGQWGVRANAAEPSLEMRLEHNYAVTQTGPYLLEWNLNCQNTSGAG